MKTYQPVIQINKVEVVSINETTSSISACIYMNTNEVEQNPQGFIIPKNDVVKQRVDTAICYLIKEGFIPHRKWQVNAGIIVKD